MTIINDKDSPIKEEDEGNGRQAAASSLESLLRPLVIEEKVKLRPLIC
jgi:hypothetical protein